MADEPTVTGVHILAAKPGTSAAKAIALVKMSDGRTVEALSWLDSLLTFTVDDFMGKTQAEINRMYRQRYWALFDS